MTATAQPMWRVEAFHEPVGVAEELEAQKIVEDQLDGAGNDDQQEARRRRPCSRRAWDL